MDCFPDPRIGRRSSHVSTSAKRQPVMRFRDTSPQRQQVLAARRAGKSRNRAAQCPKRKTAFGDRHMSTNSGNLENFQSQRMDILEKTLADKERTVERLQQDCAYYQRVILALSRSR